MLGLLSCCLGNRVIFYLNILKIILVSFNMLSAQYVLSDNHT